MYELSGFCKAEAMSNTGSFLNNLSEVRLHRCHFDDFNTCLNIYNAEHCKGVD